MRKATFKIEKSVRVDNSSYTLGLNYSGIMVAIEDRRDYGWNNNQLMEGFIKDLICREFSVDPKWVHIRPPYNTVLQMKSVDHNWNSPFASHAFSGSIGCKNVLIDAGPKKNGDIDMDVLRQRIIDLFTEKYNLFYPQAVPGISTKMKHSIHVLNYKREYVASLTLIDVIEDDTLKDEDVLTSFVAQLRNELKEANGDQELITDVVTRLVTEMLKI